MRRKLKWWTHGAIGGLYGMLAILLFALSLPTVLVSERIARCMLDRSVRLAERGDRWVAALYEEFER